MSTESGGPVVIGAGVVGLAIARALAMAGNDVTVLEAERAIGTGISSRNSEVIHAGVYYPPGSLKARCCVDGRARLYAYCRDRGIDAQAVGKLIVATRDEEIPKLQRLAETAAANGVSDIHWRNKTEVTALEPAITAVAALHSLSSGIVDSHALMLSLQSDLEAAGGVVALSHPVLGGRVEAGRIVLMVGGAQPMELAAPAVINAAGLAAPAVARAISGFPAQHVPVQHLARGNYASLSGARPSFQRLIYPVPVDGGLGIHATIDLAGQLRFGPDVEWISEVDFAPSSKQLPEFYTAIRTWWPDLADGTLTISYAGIRPKLSGPGEPAADFLIQGPATHGIAGLVNLFGIESPGLTSALSLAKIVLAALQGSPPLEGFGNGN